MGADGSTLGRGGRDAAWGSADMAHSRGMSKVDEEYEEWRKKQKPMLEALSENLRPMAQTFESLGKVSVTADQATKSLAALAIVAEALTEKMGGKQLTDKEYQAFIETHVKKMNQTTSAPHTPEKLLEKSKKEGAASAKGIAARNGLTLTGDY
jgi:hypothetical protein